ncbi:pyridine nucleotide-disulfide oxidoreductase [Paraburkholderia madseniana]|jgi:thioredoxin reductase (NADPH)|uniref:Pyridine nucleotide-disulfide oxidoreductase n=1 Tax=Paraburkholderia madseniana TaxID=2599607 RepID=A0A6N6WCN0_9BURK|nr:NAD(P)/FAD-dependent oxidoreductase [Paraburkholderia madseniana]KAE8758216.1 pyridine nucleotide-disulfide oxidoreductase [Paraburkholderia madseniana]
MAYTIRDFLHRSDVPFEWVQLTTDEEARSRAGVEHLHDPRLPVCVFQDGSRIEAPTVRQITERLGWFLTPSRAEYDLAIYGAGLAGLSAAVYASSDGLKTVLIERSAIGGQAGSSSRIENYLGFPGGISGAELAERAREQACRFGTEILVAREGVRGEFQPGRCVGYLADGTKIVSRAIICATGVEYAHLGLPKEEEYIGAGLYYGAGSSEASLTRTEHVYVVGGGNSAGQAVMHFAPFASRVSIVVRGDSLESSLSQYLVDRICASTNVEVLTRTEVAGLEGDSQLQAITLKDRNTGQERRVATHWLFVCIGGVPHTEWAPELRVMRDERGYLMTGPDLLRDGRQPPNWPLDRDPYYLETNVPGLFAVGDVRHGAVKRCASAVGEGAMAVAFVHRYLAEG